MAAAEGPLVYLEVDHFLVGVHEVLVLVLVLEAVLERILFDVSPVFELFMDLGEQMPYLL